MNRSYAPISLFVYNRLRHTQQTLEALEKNELAMESDLIVFSDGSRNIADSEKIREVRVLVHNIKGFRSIKVVERETNYGLARNIIEGVTEICNQFGRVIVLEDDMVTSPQFLSFMNASLDKYANEPRVWHISGWNYPIEPDGLGDAFFWRVMNCWGWATWADRWHYYRKDPKRLIESWDRKKIKRFNLDGNHNFWGQVKLNHSGKNNTWAIFWYASIFNNNGLCLNPSQSLIHNIGNDGSGENCGINEWRFLGFNKSKIYDYPIDFTESGIAVERVSRFYMDAKKYRSFLRLFTLKLLLLRIRKRYDDFYNLFSRLLNTTTKMGK
jgi:hypothetical protein